MKSIVCLVYSVLALGAATEAVTAEGITNRAELSKVLLEAGSGETVILAADIQWEGPDPLTLPAGIVLDGNGYTITSTPKSGALLSQVGTKGVVCRNLGLRTTHYAAWAIQVRDGDLRLENCDVHCRMIAWDGGSIAMKDCTYMLQLPEGSDHSEPIGVYGGDAELAAENCVFRIGWDVQHTATGFFHNFGGDPASRLILSRCTIIGGRDPNYSQGSRHQCVFFSENSAGPGYKTSVTDSLIMAEVKSVFRSTGNGEIVSAHNGLAGMVRNPGIMATGDPQGPRFHESGAGKGLVTKSENEIVEPNPFGNAPEGDYRLVAGSKCATGASDGGPLGANPAVVPRELNAYNLNMDCYTLVEHRTDGFEEALFDGWRVIRDSEQQHSLVIQDGMEGPAMRLEAFNTDSGMGYLTRQTARHTFITIPGYEYTIRAHARRTAIEPVGTWEANGAHCHARLWIDGARDATISSVPLDGPEGQWIPAELKAIASSTHMTINLCHGTDGSWNRVDWDKVEISARAPVGLEVPAGLKGPILGYINTIPPEDPEARAARHRKVAERRAGIPIIVHRGTSHFDPENTLEAYARAMDLGADGVEFDPRKTEDGVLYTFHDASVDRMLAGEGRGDRMTYYELVSLRFRDPKGRATSQTRVPTIVSFFQLARERAILLHFDVKEQRVEDILIGLLDRFDMWDHVVMVNPSPYSDRIRFHPKANLLEYKQNKPDFGESEAVRSFLAGPGGMIFMQYDPTPAVQALGREAPGEMPLPDGLRAWWWPDGTSRPE